MITKEEVGGTRIFPREGYEWLQTPGFRTYGYRAFMDCGSLLQTPRGQTQRYYQGLIKKMKARPSPELCCHVM